MPVGLYPIPSFAAAPFPTSNQDSVSVANSSHECTFQFGGWGMVAMLSKTQLSGGMDNLNDPGPTPNPGSAHYCNFGTFVTPVLAPDQTISGTIQLTGSFYESSGNDNLMPRLCIYIWHSNGTKGTTLFAANSTTEAGTSYGTKEYSFASNTLTSATTVVGDKLVIQIMGYENNTRTTQYAVGMRIGSNTGYSTSIWFNGIDSLVFAGETVQRSTTKSMQYVPIQKHMAGDPYSKDHVIIGSSEAAVTNYPIKLRINKGVGDDGADWCYLNNKATNWPYDVRFFNGQTELSFFRERSEDNYATYQEVWVKVNSIPINPGTMTLTIEYGTGLGDASSGANTFPVWDDFDNGSIGAMWSVTKTYTGTATESGSDLTVQNGCVIINHTTTYSTKMCFEARMRLPGGSPERVRFNRPGGTGDFGMFNYNEWVNNVWTGYKFQFSPSYGIVQCKFEPNTYSWFNDLSYDNLNDGFTCNNIAGATYQWMFKNGDDNGLYGSTFWVDWYRVRPWMTYEPMHSTWTSYGGPCTVTYKVFSHSNPSKPMSYALNNPHYSVTPDLEYRIYCTHIANAVVRMTHTMNAPEQLTNYPVQLTINRNGLMSGSSYYTANLEGCSKNWPYDIRFSDALGNNLQFWRESYTDTQQIVWVKIPSAIGTFTFNLDTGNSSWGDASSGVNTFIEFDDFSDGVINTTMWSIGGPTFSESGTELCSSGGYNIIQRQNGYYDKCIIEARFRIPTDNSMRVRLVRFGGSGDFGIFDNLNWFNNGYQYKYFPNNVPADIQWTFRPLGSSRVADMSGNQFSYTGTATTNYVQWNVQNADGGGGYSCVYYIDWYRLRPLVETLPTHGAWEGSNLLLSSMGMKYTLPMSGGGSLDLAYKVCRRLEPDELDYYVLTHKAIGTGLSVSYSVEPVHVDVEKSMSYRVNNASPPSYWMKWCHLKMPGTRQNTIVTGYLQRVVVHKGHGLGYGNYGYSEHVYLDNKCLNWPYDIRFAHGKSTNLSYYRESYDTEKQVLWVQLEKLGASRSFTDSYTRRLSGIGSNSFCIMYGDAGWGDVSTTSIFSFFDHFPGTSLDAAKWNGYQSSPNELGHLTVHDSYVDMYANTDSNTIEDAQVTITSVNQVCAATDDVRIHYVWQRYYSLNGNANDGFGAIMTTDYNKGIYYEGENSRICSGVPDSGDQYGYGSGNTKYFYPTSTYRQWSGTDFLRRHGVSWKAVNNSGEGQSTNVSGEVLADATYPDNQPLKLFAMVFQYIWYYNPCIFIDQVWVGKFAMEEAYIIDWQPQRLDMTYAVRCNVPKGLSYALKPADQWQVHLDNYYSIVTKHKAPEVGLGCVYYALKEHPTTLDADYNVLKPYAPTLDVGYFALSHHPITKGMVYQPLNEETSYNIPIDCIYYTLTTPTAAEEDLTYYALVPQPVPEDLGYSVSTTTPLDSELTYFVPLYRVVSPDMLYKVRTVHQLPPLDMVNVMMGSSFSDKLCGYRVVQSDNNPWRTLGYVVELAHGVCQPSMAYNVLKSELVDDVIPLYWYQFEDGTPMSVDLSDMVATDVDVGDSAVMSVDVDGSATLYSEVVDGARLYDYDILDDTPLQPYAVEYPAVLAFDAEDVAPLSVGVDDVAYAYLDVLDSAVLYDGLDDQTILLG